MGEEEVKYPVIYSPNYNIEAWGLEKLHPFDSTKYRRVHDFLIESGVFNEGNFIAPPIVSDEVLREVHTEQYLDYIESSPHLAMILEVPFVICIPLFVVKARVLTPMKYQTGGTILAGELALEHGWAINLGGGFHHASKGDGGGFCVFADITMCIYNLRQNFNINKVLIVDLDAHQGNGHERDFIEDKNTYIFDIYNRRIYPGDEFAKEGISKKA